MALAAPLSDAQREALDLAAWEADQAAREHLAAGRYGEASRAIRAVLEGPRGDPARILPLHLLGAEAARQTGELSDAARHLEEAQRTLAELGPEWPYRGAFEAALLDVGARNAQDLGRPEEAAGLLLRARAAAAAAGERGTVLSLEIGLANLWLEAEQHEQLETHVQAALARTDPERERSVHAALELCLATSLTVRGRSEEDADERADGLLRALVAGSDLGARDALRAHLRLAEVELRGGQIEACLARLADQEGALAALDLGPGSLERMTLEMLHARAARERAQALQGEAAAELLGSARARARGCLEDWLAAAASMPVLRDGAGLLHRGEARGFVVEVLALEQKPAAALVDLARVHALATRHRRAGRSAPERLDAAALGLEPGEGMLVYLPAILGSRLFIVDRHGVHGRALPASDQLTGARERFQLHFDPRAPATAWGGAAAELLEALLPADCRARLADWKAAVVVGLDLLRYVPFELLPLADGTPFGERFATSYAPDLVTAAWLAARERAPRASGAPLVAYLAAPQLGPPLEPIALNRSDRERLASGVPRARLVAFEGREANVENLARAASSGAAILHVLTHGAPLEGDRPGTGIALDAGRSGYRVIAPEEVDALARVPPLAILSVCRAGRGPARLGEGGLEGLVGALLERGAQCVILPYEDVELEAVLERIHTLQPLLLDPSLSPAEALRRAQFSPSTPPRTVHAALYHAVGSANRPLRRGP